MGTISFENALTCALEAVKERQEVVVELLNNAVGLVVAEDIFATKNLPSFDNSAMDGYAFSYKDKEKTLLVQHTIFAGDTTAPKLQDGSCYKIMTGAKVPEDVDTIAPYEVCTCDTKNNTIIPPKNIKQGANFRKKGEESLEGKLLIEKGTILEFSHIALLASQGVVALRCYKPLTIAILSSGNEIKEPWESATEDEIYNANAFGIVALLKSFGFNATYLGAMPDNFEKTKEFLSKLEQYDVVITTGGISHGEADFIYKAFVENGLKPLFHGIKLKPGHPTMMGTMNKQFVMGLPGNPLTTMVIAHSLSIPVLFKLQGSKNYNHNIIRLKLSQDLMFKNGRTYLVLGKVEKESFVPTNNAKVGSGMITPLCKSDAIAYIQEGVESLKAGEYVDVVLLSDATRKF